MAGRPRIDCILFISLLVRSVIFFNKAFIICMYVCMYLVEVDAEATVEPPPAPEVIAEPEILLHSDSGLPLISLKSPSSEWTHEDILLDWSEPQTVHHLLRLRDFLVEGMTVNVVEEKVQMPYTLLRYALF